MSAFPGYEEFEKKIVTPKSHGILEYAEIFEGCLNLVEMSLQLFAVIVIRSQEELFVNSSDDQKKKIKPILELLNKKFRTPSLGTIIELARGCFHLVENKKNLTEDLMKIISFFDSTIQLKELSYLFRDLDNLLNKMNSDSNSHNPAVYSVNYKMKVFKTFLPKIVEYRNDFKHGRDLSLAIEKYQAELALDVSLWRKAYQALSDSLASVYGLKYILFQREGLKIDERKRIEDDDRNLVILKEISFYEGVKTEREIEIGFNDYLRAEYSNHSQITYCGLKHQDKEILIELFPFFIIKNNNLCFYKRTTAIGYEYYDLTTDNYEYIKTKRKFNHTLFKAGLGDQQVLFWTEVLPEVNSINNIKANIPIEGKENFIGRKKQIKKIIEEIIQIPNRDGILHSPGGFGKTALMRQLSKELFNETAVENILYKNIIWVSAKLNYYNPVFDEIVIKEQQFDGLDKILTVILKFFDYENVEEYEYEDKLELVKQIFDQNQILLVVDNFETVSKKEQKDIIDFFGIEIKKYLRKKPDNLKVIITSRESIPSGFHQIELEGLDLRESKQLMNTLYESYKNVHPSLSDEQKNKLHEVTHGIPIMLIHFYGQHYEYHKPFDTIVNNLSLSGSNVLKFSYAELFKSLEKDEQLVEILILIELANRPLILRQINEILNVEETIVEIKLPMLINYQCIETINEGLQQLFCINKNVDLFTKGLIKEYPEIVKDIKSKMQKNFTYERQIDYTPDEFTAHEIFSGYIKNNEILLAEKFIKERLNKYPDSILLRYSYSKYLIDFNHKPEEAIRILEGTIQECQKIGKSIITLLRTIIKSYLTLQYPDYTSAMKYVTELEGMNFNNDEIKLEIADFYIRWSSSLNITGIISDPILQLKKQTTYKELANKGYVLLTSIKDKESHHIYYLKAQAQYNLWDYQQALENINKAIALANGDTKIIPVYQMVRKDILKKVNFRKGR